MIGELTITTGLMFSGKTESLINKYISLISNGIKPYEIIFILPIFNNIVFIESRVFNNILIKPDYIVNDLKEINFDYIKNKKHIFIDEYQFFKIDQNSYIKELLLNNINVYIYGLNSDYLNNDFGNIKNLLKICSSCNIKIIKCFYCNKNATKHYLKNKENFKKDNFEVLCDDCFDFKN